MTAENRLRSVRHQDRRSATQSRAEQVQHAIAQGLARHSIGVLRVSLGVIFLGFGALKFFPGASPAQELAVRTVDTLTFGILSGQFALLVSALAETFIGITLITGKLLKTGLVVMGGSLIGIMSPLVLFFGDLFPSFPGPLTLEAQYVLKDIVLVAAALVVAARALGARLVTTGDIDRRTT
jgi:putative oxidoreductase